MACSDCFTGTIHEGDPTGKVTTIHGLPTYVTEPTGGVKPKGIIVFIPDAFGWDFVNNRLLADNYATKGGFLVYLPEFMDGKGVSPFGLEIMDGVLGPTSWYTKPYWIAQAIYHFVPFFIGCRPSIVKPRIFKFFQDLRSSPPPFPTTDLKVGSAGFCWGGKYTFLLAADPPSSRVAPYSTSSSSSSSSSTTSSSSRAIAPLITCGFTAHPSNLSMPSEAENVVLPLSVIVGDNDMALSGKSALKLKEILEVKKKGDHEVVIIPGAKHGFSIRTDPKDKYQLECADKAEEQAIAWFRKWLA